MRAAGLDVGSRTIVLVVLDGDAQHHLIVDTGVNPLRRSQELLEDVAFDRLMVTGYGRRLVASALDTQAISEITAYARGARHLYPDCRTVIDIGGQDSKAILLSGTGQVEKFEMNDRCAAGTGKFLEVMAATLESPIGGFADLALASTRTVQINSLCTVFAESEVVSLIAKGEPASDIAMALHEAIATRVVAMVRRIGPKERIVFAGGGALNSCLLELLGEKLGHQITVPENPQVVGSLGAALLA